MHAPLLLTNKDESQARQQSEGNTNLRLMRGGVRRHMGGGGGILRGGETRRGTGRARCVKTAIAEISCPSI